MRDAIDGHVRLLLAWTTAINLTAIRDPEAVARLHVLDSLAAVPVLRQRGIDRFLDLGSGGGYPGLPLAAAVPAEAVLVESIGKKARFLEVAAGATGLSDRVGVAAVRAEQLARDPDHAGRWPVVTVRAVASLSRLIELSMPLLQAGGLLLAWKRGDLRDEIAAARPVARALGAAAPAVLAVGITGLEEHRLVIVERAAPTGRPTATGRPTSGERSRSRVPAAPTCRSAARREG